MRRFGDIVLALAAITAVAATPGAPGWEVDLAQRGEPGVPFVLEGRVLAKDSRPMRDVLVYVYHADDNGKYSEHGESRPRLAGRLRTNVLGGYRVRSILPGLAEGVPHVHFELAGPGPEYRAIALNLCRAEGAGSDTTFARLPQMQEPSSRLFWAYVRPDTDGVYRCRWDLPFERAGRLEKPPEAFASPRR